MSATQLLDGLSYPERKVLLTLEGLDGGASPERVFEAGHFQQLVEVMNASSWLQSKGLIEIKESAQKYFSLRSRNILDQGLPERKALQFIGSKDGRSTISELEQGIGKSDASLAIGWLKRKALVKIEKGAGAPSMVLTDSGNKALVEDMPDETLLRALAESDRPESDVDMDMIAQLKTRQDLIAERLVVSRELYLTDAGREVLSLGIELKEEVAQLTPELVQTGKWRDVSIRKYDVNTFAPSVFAAKKHPLTRVADEVRRIFIQMGFTEIDDEYVQAAFWNMDALFTPQIIQHVTCRILST